MTNENNTFNGWTNYATWRVNLEIFDGVDLQEIGLEGLPLAGLGEAVRSFAHEIVLDGANGLAHDYALAFLSDVNWYEIAKHLKENEDEKDAA